jgi:hypothetical protein
MDWDVEADVRYLHGSLASGEAGVCRKRESHGAVGALAALVRKGWPRPGCR